jgi:hypothetical protein
MPYTVFATNEPDRALEVDDAELVDLARMGLLVFGKGDINDRGRLKRTADAPAPELAATVTASLPTIDPSTTA